MAYVYKYVNKETKEVDYVGIIWSENRRMSQRVSEHSMYDGMNKELYDIYYFVVDTRTDSEVWESHLISYYKTYEKLNKSKSSWGECSYLKGKEDDIEWKKYIKRKRVSREYEKIGDKDWNVFSYAMSRYLPTREEYLNDFYGENPNSQFFTISDDASVVVDCAEEKTNDELSSTYDCVSKDIEDCITKEEFIYNVRNNITCDWMR